MYEPACDRSFAPKTHETPADSASWSREIGKATVNVFLLRPTLVKIHLHDAQTGEAVSHPSSIKFIECMKQTKHKPNDVAFDNGTG